MKIYGGTVIAAAASMFMVFNAISKRILEKRFSDDG